MALTIFWTSTARKQRADILKYWNKRNGSTEYSKKIRNQVSFRLKQLVKFPEAGKETDFPDTRVTALGHFSFFYKMIGDKLIITCFWDNRNNPVLVKDLISQT